MGARHTGVLFGIPPRQEMVPRLTSSVYVVF